RAEGDRLGERRVAARGTTAAVLEAWIVFDDEAGFSITPPTSRTWSRRGNHTGHPGPRPFPAPLLHRSPVLLQTRRTLPPRLPAQTPHRSQERRPQELRLDRVPRPAHRRPPAARWTGRPQLGQLELPRGPSDAGLHRRTRLAHRRPPAGLRTRPKPRWKAYGRSSAAPAGPTPPSPTQTTSSAGYGTASARSNTAATSSTDAAPQPDSH
ncbi:LOW QUALITY PROTEIN: IS630 family transposase, partial [Streptomyces sp. C]